MEGITVTALDLHPDDRGFFCEIYRQDWHGLFDEPVVQFNLSSSFPGIVRAWHRHSRGQVDYFVVVEGTLQICAYDAATREMCEVVASHRRPCVVRIPGHYYHGTRAVGNLPSLVVYGTNRLYDYASPDEERLPWNDSSIVPVAINGSTIDARVGQPWDWLRPPHR